MVCDKCAQKTGPTTLATAAVRRKHESAYVSGSNAALGGGGGSSSSSGKATLGNTGISKPGANKLFKKYAGVGASKARPRRACPGTKDVQCTKILLEGKLCSQCAYRVNKCHLCGRAATKGTQALVSGQKFTNK